jgi:hypothetical protein
MDGRITLCPATLAGPQRPVKSVRPCGKTGFSSDPRGKQEDRPQPGRRAEPHLTITLLCRDGTSASDPVWDGPRIQPAFAAQLIGQMMPSAERAAPGDGYARAGMAVPPRLDLRR